MPLAMNDNTLTETQLGSEIVLHGRFLQVQRDLVQLPDGNQATREYIVHPGAVMVIAQMDDGCFVMERQYRYPVQRVMIEFPAGKLDLGESGLDCAQRELLEETGFTAREWARAGVLHPVISYSTEFIEVWFARSLTAGPQKLDAGEFIEVFTANIDGLLAWCAEGLVTDAKTLSGLLWLQNVLSGRWVLDWQNQPGLRSNQSDQTLTG